MLHPHQFNAERSPYAQEVTPPPLLQGELRAGASRLPSRMPQNLSVGPISTGDASDLIISQECERSQLITGSLGGLQHLQSLGTGGADDMV